MRKPPPRRSSEAEIEALQAVCERLAGFDDRVSLEWLDGTLAALAAGPRVPALEEALPAIVDDAWARTFADPDDVAQALAAVQARWRVLLSQLDPDALADDFDDLRVEPLMLQAADSNDDWLPGEDWARGFLAVVADPAWGWNVWPADAGYIAALARIAALKPIALDIGAATRDELITGAAYAVQDLRLWWMDHAPTTAPRHVEAAPGRNDPCPCGSGRKYKKCHGAR